MKARQTSLRLVLIPVLLSLLVALPVSGGVCGVTTTNRTTFTSVNPDSIVVSKTLDASHSCQLTMSMNVLFCFPQATAMLTNRLVATAQTGGGPNPSCGWVCNCPTGTVQVTIDGITDGLPVELMDFGVVEDPESENSDKDVDG